MTFQVTTDGLTDLTAAAAAIANVGWAAASGTAQAILAANTPANTALTDGLCVGVRALLANTAAAPTFNLDGLGAYTITKRGGVALKPGDIAGPLAELLLRYNLTNTRWELLNPGHTQEPWVAAGGTADAITATYAPVFPALVDGQIATFRALLPNATTAPTFSPNSLTARTITRGGGQPLVQGDIPGLLAECIVRYNLANTRWELLNPATPGPSLFKSLTAGVAGQNIATVQPWFPTLGAVSVIAGQAYEFDGFLFLVRSAGTTSHTTGVSFTGTATLTSIAYLADAMTGDANALAATNAIQAAVATNVVVKAASTSASENAMIRVRGIVVILAAGTFIPNFTYSAIPGGAPTVQIGSYFRMTPLGNPQGTWA